MSANGKGATVTVSAATLSQRPAVKPPTDTAAKVVSQAKQEAKKPETETDKLLDKMTAQQLCKELYGTSIKYGVIAMRLLAKTGSTQAAKREYANFLKTMYPSFTVRGEGTKKGEANYEAQRHYNNLDYYYRADRDSNKGQGRTFETSITMFLSACHKEENKGTWIKQFVAALDDKERAAMKKLL